jgi:hypothetical protein
MIHFCPESFRIVKILNIPPEYSANELNPSSGVSSTSAVKA